MSGNTDVEKKNLFHIRKSPLTIALRNPDHEATFAVVKVLTLFLVIATAVLYIMDPEMLFQDLGFLVQQFSPIHVSLAMEVVYLISAITLLLSMRTLMQPLKPQVVKAARFGHTLVVFAAFGTVVCGPLYIQMIYDLHFVLVFAMAQQQIRVLMKFISFLVENERQLMKQSDVHQSLPTVKSLMYFMFAPTLIYQHSYPRSPSATNWKLVAHHLMEWLFIFVPSTLLVTRFLMPVWQCIGTEPVTIHLLYKLFIGTVAASFLKLVCVGYFFLHCWLNMWAEMLTFGDRQFYRNHWSARDDVTFASNWNYMVKSWLVRYVYSPCIEKTGSRIVAGIFVFFASVAAHDYAYSSALGFFFPLMATVFVCAQVPLMLLGKQRDDKGSIAVRMSTLLLFLTLSGMAAAMEYWSRQNCPARQHTTGSYSLIELRSFSCLSYNFSTFSRGWLGHANNR